MVKKQKEILQEKLSESVLPEYFTKIALEELHNDQANELWIENLSKRISLIESFLKK